MTARISLTEQANWVAGLVDIDDMNDTFTIIATWVDAGN